MKAEHIPILAVALITWGGVFLYLVRLHLLLQQVRRELDVVQPRGPEKVEPSLGGAPPP